MNQEDIIRMAREAGWSGLYTTYNEPTGEADWKMVKESLTVPVTMEQIERFAALVAAAEREACAELTMQGTNEPVQTKTLEILRKERERIAVAIRARSKQ